MSGKSGAYTDSFETYLQPQVIGTKLSSLTSLSQVGGASLTTQAFLNALDQIRAQATV